MPWALAIVSLLAVSLAIGHLSPPDSLSLLLVVGFGFFEMSCVSLPGLGLFSAGAACSLALILHGGGGLAALVACIVLGIRLAAKGQPVASIIDLVPLLVCCLAYNLLQGWGGGVAQPLLVPPLYLGTHGLLLHHFAARLPRSEYVPWLRLQVGVQEMRLLVVLASLGLAYIPPDHLVLALLALPLWATHRAVAYGIFRLHSQDASRALDALDALQRTLELATRETDQARRELQVSVEDRRLLEELSHNLTRQPDSTQALDYVLEVSGRLGRYQTVAIFQVGPAGLAPLRYRSPHSARLESAPLLKLQEPLLELAVQTGQAQLLRAEPANRIFSGEVAAVVVPLGERAVLYAGRPGPALSEAECRSLLSLAWRAGPLLEATQRRYQESRQLQQSQQQSQLLAGQVSLLTSLLESSQHLFSSLEGERLLDLCEEALHKLLPHQGGQIWLQPTAPARQWGEGADGELLGSMVATVVQSGRPLLLPRLADGSRRSCLCAPFPALPRQDIRGAVLLIHAQPNAFQREHQDALTLFVQQLGLALANAAYVRQVIETQAQLVQSSKMTAVGQLAAGIAHELNSPLGAIALALESVARSIEAPAAVKKLERAGASTERCRKIVEKLLIYTRLGSPVRERTNLKELVEDTLDFFQTHLELDGYELHLDLQEGVCVLALAQEIQQVLVSLLLNAKESYLSTTRLPKKIAISCGQSAGQGWLMVRDAGVGIAEEDLQRVFEPFYTNKTIGKNIGLGLSVALEIVQQHGGDLALKSAPGQGTTARLSLPLAPQSNMP